MAALDGIRRTWEGGAEMCERGAGAEGRRTLGGGVCGVGFIVRSSVVGLRLPALVDAVSASRRAAPLRVTVGGVVTGGARRRGCGCRVVVGFAALEPHFSGGGRPGDLPYVGRWPSLALRARIVAVKRARGGCRTRDGPVRRARRAEGYGLEAHTTEDGRLGGRPLRRARRPDATGRGGGRAHRRAVGEICAICGPPFAIRHSPLFLRHSPPPPNTLPVPRSPLPVPLPIIRAADMRSAPPIFEIPRVPLRAFVPPSLRASFPRVPFTALRNMSILRTLQLSGPKQRFSRT